MLTVDYRAGSANLAPLLRAKGLPVRVGNLTFGDVSFVGHGPEGCPVPIGIEVKTIRDVLSCIVDGRFAGHQLPGLVTSYSKVYLLVEGGWRPCSKSGILQVRRTTGSWSEGTVGTRRFMYRDLLTWLFTVVTKAGIELVRCDNWQEATIWLSALYNWWTQKDWESHRAHLALNTAHDNQFFDRALLTRPSLARLVAKELPGIGFQKSATVSAHFGSVENMVLASVDEWAEIEGIGPTMARRIVNVIRKDSRGVNS